LVVASGVGVVGVRTLLPLVLTGTVFLFGAVLVLVGSPPQAANKNAERIAMIKK
jgi:hypothetical protein